ncbi:hypothetical protein PRK78_004365 [Emydomyces testavorans]|uniref:Uncharacterized protein n=1 Tax=Emydomyces testavorans TaxID=2070801 RepID=A0AAF0DJS4_9EURO|nr:hypothetical protein PRK78_004365 [Emydomyces testavorans]
MSDKQSPEAVFNSLRTLVHQLRPKPQTYPYDPEHPQNLSDAVRITFECLTNAVAYSTITLADDGTEQVQDFILMQHEINYIPITVTRTGFDSYQFLVRPLTDEAAKKIKQGDPIPSGDKWYRESKEITNGTNFDVELIQSIPPHTGTLANFSASTSTSFDASAGFMGEAPSATLSESTSMACTVSYSTPSVSVDDHSDLTFVDKVFVMNPVGPAWSGITGQPLGPGRLNDPGRDLFSTTVSELWCIPDDKTGKRDKLGTTSRHFEIKMTAYKYLKHDERTHWGIDRPDEEVVLTNTVSYLEALATLAIKYLRVSLIVWE